MIDAKASRRKPWGWHRRWRLALLLIPLALSLSSCGKTEVPVYTTQFNAFNTRVDLSLVGVRQGRATEAAQAIERDFAFFDQVLFRNESGRMLRMNELLATGEPFAMPTSIIPLVKRLQRLASQSEERFNPAIGRLYRLWGLDEPVPIAKAPPEPQAIEALVQAQPRMSDLYLNGIELQSDNPAVQLELDAVAWAYAMDLAVEALQTQGVRSAMINVAGDVRVIGDRSGRPWRIPVPRASGTGVVGILDVSGDASLCTASTQRRNYVYRGQLYHAVLDPRTGYPASQNASATVLHEGDALTATAAAHALMIAAPEDWSRIAAAMGIRYALIVDQQGHIHLTPDMDRILDPLDLNRKQTITAQAYAQTQAPAQSGPSQHTPAR